MRTADSCPICTTYIDASCIIYNGLYLSTIDVEPKDSLEEALGKINAAFSTLQPSLGFTPENVVNKSPNTSLGGATPSDTLYPTQKAVKDYVDAQRPYKVYVALLSQSGTSAPVATVLENTLGGTVVWTRNSAGDYSATLTGAFTAGKTVCFYTHDSINGSTGFGGAARFDDDTVGVGFNNITGIFIDADSLSDSIEIRVYP